MSIKCHVVDCRSHMLDEPIGSYDEVLFHGEIQRGSRDVLEYPEVSGAADPYAPAELLRHPAEWYRTTAHRPAAARPRGAELLVSDKVRNALGSPPGARFSPVTFGRLVDVPWSRGHVDAALKAALDAAGDWVLFCRGRPAASLDVVPRYWELVVQQVRHVAPNYPGSKRVEVTAPKGAPILAIRNHVPLDAMRDNPILGTAKGLVLRDDVFDILRPFLDPDFFVRWELR
jgi:hypothetical protein